MFVWLHTSSPPQHIGHEPFEGSVRRLPATLADINTRRGLRCEVALIAHHEDRREDHVHIFDTSARARAWMERNAARVEVVHIV